MKIKIETEQSDSAETQKNMINWNEHCSNNSYKGILLYGILGSEQLEDKKRVEAAVIIANTTSGEIAAFVTFLLERPGVVRSLLVAQITMTKVDTE